MTYELMQDILGFRPLYEEAAKTLKGLRAYTPPIPIDRRDMVDFGFTTYAGITPEDKKRVEEIQEVFDAIRRRHPNLKKTIKIGDYPFTIQL